MRDLINNVVQLLFSEEFLSQQLTVTEGMELIVKMHLGIFALLFTLVGILMWYRRSELF